MSCGIGCRHGLDPVWLWLWHRLAAVALIGPLAWEPPYAVGVAIKKAKQTNQKKINFNSIDCKICVYFRTLSSIPMILCLSYTSTTLY